MNTNKTSDIVLYYSEELHENLIQLSDERLLWKVIPAENDCIYLNEEWSFLIAREATLFYKKFNTHFILCGRSDRHVCVKDTVKNRKLYDKMIKYIEERQASMVKDMNEYVQGFNNREYKTFKIANTKQRDDAEQLLISYGLTKEKAKAAVKELSLLQFNFNPYITEKEFTITIK